MKFFFKSSIETVKRKSDQKKKLHFLEQYQLHAFFSLASSPGRETFKKEILQDMYETKMLSLGWVYCRPMKELFVKISVSETAKSFKTKNTNNHALKHLPFYEGEGLTSGFIKK